MSGSPPPGKQTYQGGSSSASDPHQQLISRPVRRHLVHVYLVLAAMLGLSAIGSVTQSPFNGLIETGVTFGSAMGVMTLPRDNMIRWPLLGVSWLYCYY